MTLAATVTRWYATAARDLPWRAPGTSPWAILVSEVMLQQTPVPRVLPVYLDWVTRWPTPATLAAAPAGEAVRAWGRLGYPRRALRLHQCAGHLVATHDGRVPATVPELLALPGIGAYTARAVAAFAHGARVPVVDTNVRRVVARAVGGHPDGGAATTPADLAAVEALLPHSPRSAVRTSAALMELGALICTARAPLCPACPLRRDCAWRRAGAPAPLEPRRRAQRYAGTDRQARGHLLAVLRSAPVAVASAALLTAVADPTQARRALASLLTDGLVVAVGPDHYGLPDHDQPDHDRPDHQIGQPGHRGLTELE